MAATTDLTIDLTRFESSLTAFMVGSKRAVEDVLRAQMKGVIRSLIKVTPPGHFTKTATGNTLVIGNAAKKAGEATVERDIRSMYGTPSQAYDSIAAISAGQAAGFWKHHLAGEEEAARAIVRRALGSGYAPFDGGTVHQRFKGRGRPRKARRTVYFVSDAEALKAYIKERQKHIFWLAAGWAEAARAFGVAMPQMIARHSAPGLVRIEVTDNLIRFTATNAVNYARGIADMERRVQWAVDSQARAMEKIIVNQLAQAAKKAGFVVAGTIAS